MKETDYFLKEFKILVSNLDYQTLTKLKQSKEVSEADLCLVGDIILSSWRNFC